MASGLLPKSPVSSSLCDEVPHIFIPKSHLEPREFLISSAKRLLQQYLPKADIRPTGRGAQSSTVSITKGLDLSLTTAALICIFHYGSDVTLRMAAATRRPCIPGGTG